jgi:hypothetical protein
MTLNERARRSMDFFLPLQTRKWLQCLVEDPVSGLRIIPGLKLDADVLGFTFASNDLGLRGPANPEAPNVVLGTSFAMGFCVDNGDNWFELCLDPGEWLNLGLPVGAGHLAALMTHLHTGKRGTALVVYHPTFWPYTRQYLALARSGLGAFDFFGWKTDKKACLDLQLGTLARRKEKIRTGQALSISHKGREYFVDATILRYDFNSAWDDFLAGLSFWETMLTGFEKVIVVRAYTKQELCPSRFENRELLAAKANYQLGWALFKKFLGPLPGIRFHEPRGFGLEHHLPLDGHWDGSGNALFAEQVACWLK